MMPSFFVQLEHGHGAETKSIPLAAPCGVLFAAFPCVSFSRQTRSLGLGGRTAYGGFYSSSSLSTAMNASVGICTVPRERIFFLPSFCFSSSFFFRVMSPP